MRILRAAALGLALCIAGQTPLAAQTQTFKVGVIASFTGAFATWGAQFQQGIEAYQAVHGKTVKSPKGDQIEVQFIYRDAASAGADKAKQLMEELVLRDKVNMVAGFDLTPHAMAVADIATESKIPVLLMNAASNGLNRASPYFVRDSFSVAQLAATLGKWAAENGIKRVYTIVADYSAGIDFETYFTKAFKAGGGEIIGSARSPIRETDFGPYMERILQARPDAVYMFQPAGAPSSAFMKAFSERGLKEAGIKLLGQAEFSGPYLPNYTDNALGAISVLHYTETNNLPENLQMKAQLSKMFGEKAVPDIATVGGWDGAKLIYLALQQVGASASGMEMINAMTGKVLQSPRGEFEIDAKERDVTQDIYIRRVDKKDGKLQNVDIATYKLVKDPWALENPIKK
jgi:branched-chain amino acid transport system substrate-binding protein